ncbi:Murein DD-endopeptidase MepH precursor [compost metagenome]
MRKISVGDADPGDLMFFQDQTKLSHVGIYLGDGRFVHAPASGQNVAVSSLDTPYYQAHLVAVGRLLPH